MAAAQKSIKLGEVILKIEHNSQLEFYRTPFGAVTEGTEVRLRLAVSQGGIPGYVRVNYFFKGEKYFANMAYIFEAGGCCFYEAKIIMPNSTGLVHYCFEIQNSEGRFFYTDNERHLGGLGMLCSEKPEHAYQITVYSRDYKTPEWFKDTVVYQIFPDRFANGNEDGGFSGNREDIIKRSPGDTPFYKAEQFGGEYLANDFFGGNLKGIEQKLVYLAELGIGAVYLNPIFRAYSNHKYDTGSYMEIDPSFGTEEDFRRLCKRAEELGIRIILDGVFNHTGSDSLYFNKNGSYDSVGAYQSKDSPYYDWYSFEEWNERYDCWWGMKTLPNLNERSESCQKYLLDDENSVVRHWLGAGAYGWRLDVVDELPGFFVKKLRRAVKSKKEDAVIIGEVWEDASNKCSYGEEREYFLGEELDSVMNYPMRRALIDIAKGNIDAAELSARLMSLKENYPKQAYYSLLNLLSSHDVERILTAVSNAPDGQSVDRDFQAGYSLPWEEYELAVRRVKQLVMFQMLMPGVPCVYYGDEAAMQGYGDPFCRKMFPWDNQNEDMKLWYKTAIALRKSSPAYVSGDFETLYAVGSGYGFIRCLGDDKHIVLLNFSDKQELFRTDAARFDVHRIESEIYEDYEEVYTSEDGIYYIDMPPWSVKVFSSR